MTEDGNEIWVKTKDEIIIAVDTHCILYNILMEKYKKDARNLVKV